MTIETLSTFRFGDTTVRYLHNSETGCVGSARTRPANTGSCAPCWPIRIEVCESTHGSGRQICRTGTASCKRTSNDVYIVTLPAGADMTATG